jgi:hypothetical protein
MEEAVKKLVYAVGALCVLVCGSLFYSGQAMASTSSRGVTANTSALPWLKNVQKVEKVLINVGRDLQKVGRDKTASAELADVRKAEKDNAKAIAMYKSGPKAPSKYATVDKLLARSLQEYKNGLATVDRGFVKHSTALINQGLKTISKGTADQNKVAVDLKKVK